MGNNPNTRCFQQNLFIWSIHSNNHSNTNNSNNTDSTNNRINSSNNVVYGCATIVGQASAIGRRAGLESNGVTPTPFGLKPRPSGPDAPHFCPSRMWGVGPGHAAPRDGPAPMALAATGVVYFFRAGLWRSEPAGSSRPPRFAGPAPPPRSGTSPRRHP